MFICILFTALFSIFPFFWLLLSTQILNVSLIFFFILHKHFSSCLSYSTSAPVWIETKITYQKFRFNDFKLHIIFIFYKNFITPTIIYMAWVMILNESIFFQTFYISETYNWVCYEKNIYCRHRPIILYYINLGSFWVLLCAIIQVDCSEVAKIL